MKKDFVFITLFLLSGIVLSQRPSLELTFTAIDNTSYVPVDSIKIMNRTQGEEKMLYWPDTVLLLDYVGMEELSSDDELFRVYPNYPNPFAEETVVSIQIPGSSELTVRVTDIMGRILTEESHSLDKGYHRYRLAPGPGELFFLTAFWKGSARSIKILQHSAGSGGRCDLDYLGPGSSAPQPQLWSTGSVQDFNYSLGDRLLFIAYRDDLQSGIPDAPMGNQDYTFQFAAGLPCPGGPTMEYEGQVYNTVQIFSQCWMKDNLNAGTMIDSYYDQTDNDILEKYCYEEITGNCDLYGALYQWDEMMQYSTEEGVRGICPEGWHIPTDEEWKILEGSVDSEYGIGDPEWDVIWKWRGYDAGKNLKSTTLWNQGGNGTDLYGFNGMPAGYATTYGDYSNIGNFLGLPSSSNYGGYRYWGRSIFNDKDEVYQSSEFWKLYAYSVRCIRN